MIGLLFSLYRCWLYTRGEALQQMSGGENGREETEKHGLSSRSLVEPSGQQDAVMMIDEADSKQEGVAQMLSRHSLGGAPCLRDGACRTTSE